MNRAFYIIAIPAFIVSFCWLFYGWGLGIASAVIIVELVAAIGGMIYLRRRKEKNPRAGTQRSSQ
jgi:Na+-driven multidrug efflux pump